MVLFDDYYYEPFCHSFIGVPAGRALGGLSPRNTGQSIFWGVEAKICADPYLRKIVEKKFGAEKFREFQNEVVEIRRLL